MNSAYHKTVSLPVDVVPQEVPEDAAVVQMRTEWSRHPITKEFFEKLSKDIVRLQDEAVALATVNHQGQHNGQITNKLIQADTLRKVINGNK